LTHLKQPKFFLLHQGLGICYTVLIIYTAVDVTERILAVLYVSIMGLTHCYKMKDFLHLYLQFSTDFTLQMYITTQNCLRFCKSKWKPYWNTLTVLIFTAQLSYASAVLGVVIFSVRPSVTGVLCG